MNRFLKIALTFCAVSYSGSALAQSSVEDSQELANQVVSQTASAQVASTTVAQVSVGISNAISIPAPSGPGAPVITGDAGTQYFNTRALAGESAGGSEPRFGAWVQVGNTWVDGSDPGGEFDGSALVGTLGLDYKSSDAMVVGVALGIESMDIDTKFNRGTFKGTGYSITPYIGVNLNENWQLSGLLGYSMVEYDVTAGSTNSSGSFDADRYVANGQVEGTYFFDAVRVSPRVGVLYMREKQDGYTDSRGTAISSSTINLGRLGAGATVGYNIGGVEPYARAVAEYDFVNEDPVNLGNGQFTSDNDYGINGAVGLNLRLSDNVSGNIEGSSGSILRDNLDIYTLSGRLRITW